MDKEIVVKEWRGGNRKGSGRPRMALEAKKMKEGLKSLKPQTIKDFKDALNDFYSLSKDAVKVLRESLTSPDISSVDKAQLALQILKKGIPADILKEHEDKEKPSITVIIPGKIKKNDWEQTAVNVIDVTGKKTSHEFKESAA